MHWFRERYRHHEIWVRLAGALGFVVIVASLYVFVFAGLGGGSASGTTLQITPTPFGGGISPVATLTFPALPTEPPASPTPPLLPPRYQVVVHANLAYKPGSLVQRLDLCEPVGAPGPRPAVLLIHDIGIQVEDKVEYSSFCSVLASQGFVAAAMNMRGYPSLWPDQLEDAQLAVRWLRANASQYHLNPARLCALGDSAGAHLAVFLGVLGTIYPGDEARLLTDQSPRVSCVVDEFGFVDLMTLPNDDFWKGAFGFMFGPYGAKNPVTLHQASPIFSVDARSAPTLIIQGTLDQIVPPSQSQELQRALQNAHVPVSYISYPGGHSFSQLIPQQVNAIKLRVIAYLEAQEHP